MNSLRSSEFAPLAPSVRLTGDVQLMQHHADLLDAAAAGIYEVNSVAGWTTKLDQASLEHGEALSVATKAFKNDHGQVQFEPLADFMYEAGFTNPASPAHLLLTDDLVAKGTEFVLGAALKEVGFSVQSVYRFAESIHDLQLLTQTTQFIARHEYGHLLGLDATTIRHLDTRHDLSYGHCLNECTMQQVMNVPEAATQSQRLAGKPAAGFCSDCQQYLQQLAVK